MPCSDGGPTHEQLQKARREAEVAKAGLCMMLSIYGIPTISHADAYKESGISRVELMRWWGQHQKEDERRRKREAEQKKKRELQKLALNKLSPEEKKALGLQGKYTDEDFEKDE